MNPAYFELQGSNRNLKFYKSDVIISVLTGNEDLKSMEEMKGNGENA